MEKRLKKRLGQHLLAPEWVRRIVDLAAVAPGERILEIGPGPGNMTRLLADAVGPSGRVVAVELDQDWRSALAAMPPQVQVVWGDVLQIDLREVLPDAQWRVVANIPYYLTAPLLERLIELRERIPRMALLMQKEVAERLDARSGRDVGAVSHFVHLHFDTRIALEVPAGAFTPPPEVESALLLLERREAPAVSVPPEILFPVIRTAFAGRRKMLRRSLRGLSDALDMAFERAGVAGERRPEDLTLQEWDALARAIASLRPSV